MSPASGKSSGLVPVFSIIMARTFWPTRRVMHVPIARLIACSNDSSDSYPSISIKSVAYQCRSPLETLRHRLMRLTFSNSPCYKRPVRGSETQRHRQLHAGSERLVLGCLPYTKNFPGGSFHLRPTPQTQA